MTKTFGRITNYRTGPLAQTNRECLIAFENVNSIGAACKFIGKKVVWNKKLTGKIVGAHGKNGMVRAKFVKGVPGQALGTLVELIN